MEREERFESGERGHSNGTSPRQEEAQASVFEDGQNRDIEGKIRPVKDGEPFVYGDSRPDDRDDRGGFVSVDDSPMMTTTREDFPDAHKPDPQLLAETSHGQDDEIRPQYRKKDDSEGQVIVKKESSR